MIEKITDSIQESILVKQKIIENDALQGKIYKAIEAIVTTYKNDGKVLFCGNGGSAADAQHLAAELSGRFKINRAPLFAEALHVNPSYITAVANDYSFDVIYSRLVEAYAKDGDILVAISTSGNSKNIINAVKQAKKQNTLTIGFTGEDGGDLYDLCDILINVPSENTPHIQEAHITIGHIICDIVEQKLFA